MKTVSVTILEMQVMNIKDQLNRLEAGLEMYKGRISDLLQEKAMLELDLDQLEKDIKTLNAGDKKSGKAKTEKQ